MTGTISHLDEIDERIRLRTEHWRISRMATVDRNLLRLAVFEFLHQPSTPTTVAINEALEIARRFSTHEATQFINGILDAIKRDVESQVIPEMTAATMVQHSPDGSIHQQSHAERFGQSDRPGESHELRVAGSMGMQSRDRSQAVRPLISKASRNSA